MDRRDFLRQSGLAAGYGLMAGAATGASGGVAIVLDPDDPVAASAPARWAARELAQSLSAQGVSVAQLTRADQAAIGSLCIVAAGRAAALAHGVLKAAGVSLSQEPESLALAPGRVGNRPVLLACGSDARGLVYALLELADRVRMGAEPLAALAVPKPVVERPANRIRSVARAFVSDVEDKEWYNDRVMWPEYLSMLATQRL